MMVINPYVVDNMLVGKVNGKLKLIGRFSCATGLFVRTEVDMLEYEFTDDTHENIFWHSVELFKEDNIEEE